TGDSFATILMAGLCHDRASRRLVFGAWPCLAGRPFAGNVAAAMTLLASWNVNSIKARLPNVLDWVKSAKPDILLLQEIKCVDEAFPTLEFGELGYDCAVVGQKSYNGVAILSKTRLEVAERALPGDDAFGH